MFANWLLEEIILIPFRKYSFMGTILRCDLKLWVIRFFLIERKNSSYLLVFVIFEMLQKYFTEIVHST